MKPVSWRVGVIPLSYRARLEALEPVSCEVVPRVVGSVALAGQTGRGALSDGVPLSTTEALRKSALVPNFSPFFAISEEARNNL